MDVVDLIDEQDSLIAHQHTFFLMPQYWQAYNLSDTFKWEIHAFHADQVANIPKEPGIYSFVIQPSIASHPYCSYLMYIGKTSRTLQERFREYLREQVEPEGRSKIVRLLNKYKGYLHFCFSAIGKEERMNEIEDALINAFLPPCNAQFPAEVRRIIGAFQ